MALPTWASIADRFGGGVLLLGNGASRAIWDRYAYSSLFDFARSQEAPTPLDKKDQQLFEAFDTTNFEEILASLTTTMTVNKILGRDVAEESTRQASIRKSLIAAVRQLHVPYPKVPSKTLETLRDVMASHSSVYTTNYDLLAYWALMKDKDGKDRFIDYFWSGCFDMADTARHGDRTRLLFLHGAVHLYRSEDGRTCKDVADATKDLLTKVTEANVDPVFVSEGTSVQKERAIRRSDYLTFAHTQLATEEGAVVVFGHSLGDQDAHIARAMNRYGLRIAISIRARDDADARSKQGAYQKVLPKPQLDFFDAATHPFGAPEMKTSDA